MVFCVFFCNFATEKLKRRIMRKIIVVTAFLLGALTGQAQERVMNVVKTDGTSTLTRVAELEKISFLTVEEGSQGLLVKTRGGETAGVRFLKHPVVTMEDGRLTVTYGEAETMEFEIADIAEIMFGDATNAEGISTPEGFAFELQGDGAQLRNIPESTRVQVYSIDGRCLPSPTVSNGTMLLSRSTLGTGIFIVKIGTFTTKIKL